MSKKTIEKNLRKALLENGSLVQALFEYELEEHIDEYKLSKLEDQDMYFFAVTEHSNDVAMLLIDQEGNLHINTDARAVLQEFWAHAYKSNIEKLIPDMGEQLHAGYLYTVGVTMVDEHTFQKAVDAFREKLGKNMLGRGGK